MEMEQGRDEKTSRRRRAVVVGLALLTAAAVVVAIIIAVYLTRQNCKEPSTPSPTDDIPCDVIDVAVVGAGIGGAYTAWRLRDRGLSITLYEYTDRVGGRLHTVHLPDIPDVNVELGGMRFLPRFHRLINTTAHHLGLTVTEFPPGLGFSDSSMLYLRRTHVTRANLGGASTPYNLKPEERKNSRQLSWELFHNQTSGNGTDPTGLSLWETHDGTSLYNQTVEAAYHTMGASSEAALYLRDALGFHSYFGDVAAALSVPIDHPGNSGGPVTVSTIAAGMEELPQSMVREFLAASDRYVVELPQSMVRQFLAARDRHSLKLNHKLESIHKQNDVYELMFLTTETTSGYTDVPTRRDTRKVCAKKVVLTMPRYSLERVEWEGFNDRRIWRYITKSVTDAPAAKVFLAYDRAWWRDIQLNFTHSVSDLPNRQTYDFGTSRQSSRSVLLAAYTDMGDSQFWRDLQSRGHSIPGTNHSANRVTDTVVRHAHGYLAELYNVTASVIPAPISGAMSLWDKFPYGAAWHCWRPGYDWATVEAAMIRPSPTHHVFVATASFYRNHGSAWAENALQVVEKMLHQLTASLTS